MNARVHGVSIAYDRVGAGIPLLLIHGYPLSRKIWTGQVASILGAEVIAPDLRGFGDSEAAPGPYSMDLLASDCLGLLDELGIHGRVIVGGLSMGGYVALAFQRLFPERTAGLILAATRAGADGQEARQGRDASIRTAQDQGVAAITAGMLPKLLAPETYQEKPALVAEVEAILNSASVNGVVGALAGMRERPDSTPLLAGIELPVLILHGNNDQLIPPKEAEAMHAAIRNSRLQIFPGCGHLLNMEQPELFNQAIAMFLPHFNRV